MPSPCVGCPFGFMANATGGMPFADQLPAACPPAGSGGNKTSHQKLARPLCEHVYSPVWDESLNVLYRLVR